MSLLFKLGRKGVINFIEAIFVIIIIFTAFAVLFPGLSFKNRWSDATIILSARDLLVTMDRLNIIYQNSFNSTSLQRFIDLAFPVNRTSLVAWSTVEGTLKNMTVVACNCSDQQIQNLTYWMSGMQVNGRDASMVFIKTKLESINPSDAVLIWGNTNLDTPQIMSSLINYLKNGGGIVEINDISSSSQTQPGGVQQQIFGLTYSGSIVPGSGTYFEVSDYFPRKPASSSDIIYGTYKYFSHIPAPLKTFQMSSSIPLETGMQQPLCLDAYQGNVTLNDTSHSFWICNSTTVYFDANNNSLADTPVSVGGKFSLSNVATNFTLNYVKYPSQIGISFDPNYNFQDFLTAMTSPGTSCADAQYIDYVIQPADGNMLRVPVNSTLKLPAVVLNNTLGRTAWIADFANNPNFNCTSFAKIGDDNKLLLASLLLWASNKQQTITATNINGLVIPYVNVQNSDMYEVYKLNLGLGSPFSS